MEETRSNWPYNEYDDLVCSICRKQEKISGCTLLEGTILEVLEVVLINLNLTTIQPVICKDCNKKLLDAFQHKSKWIYTEDRLFPYVNSAIDGKVDIKSVYLSENDCKLFDIQETDIQICRLCMELINNNSWDMLFEVLEKQYSVELFEKYVPELNLNVIENPIICKSCLESMSLFLGFIAFYQCNEMKTEDYFEAEVETKPYGINSEIIEDLKQNKMEDRKLKCTKYPHVLKDMAHLLKYASIHKARKQARPFNSKICSYRSSFKVDNHLLTHPTKSLKCVTCEFRTNNKSDFKKHGMRHKSNLIDPVETEIFGYAVRSYKAKPKEHLRSGLLIHKRLSHMELVKCALCSYKTKYKRNLRRHLLVHNLASNVKIFKCEFCSFKTKHTGSLHNHILIHKPLSEVKVFKCEFCSFETKRKRGLQSHILIHKALSEVEVFKCEFCSFETKHKGNLRRHILIHKPHSEVELFKCEFCTFRTKHKDSLQQHTLIHKPLSELEMFKCEVCSYETKRRGNLRNHIFIHKSLSEVKVFKCEFCTFETKRKSDLQRHSLVHKSLSEVEVFKCGFCSYKTKFKGNLRQHILIHKKTPH